MLSVFLDSHVVAAFSEKHAVTGERKCGEVTTLERADNISILLSCGTTLVVHAAAVEVFLLSPKHHP